MYNNRNNQANPFSNRGGMPVVGGGGFKQEEEYQNFPPSNSRGMMEGASYANYQTAPPARAKPPPARGNPRGGGGGGFSHKASAVPTDLQCYFECPESFKKDYDLRLHLKLRHRNENPAELERAYQAAEEEIALVSRSGMSFECAICRKQFKNDKTFYDHTGKSHNIKWRDYKEQYGTGEVVAASFECKICGTVLKYIPNNVHSHLKGVHGLNWVKYIDRIRKMRRGEVPEELPSIDVFQCWICNVSVKGLKDHVWNVHRLTEAEYEDRNNRINAGEEVGELPSAETFECKICKVQVKYFREHLKNGLKPSIEKRRSRVAPLEPLLCAFFGFDRCI
jgi:hypothetical protein